MANADGCIDNFKTISTLMQSFPMFGNITVCDNKNDMVCFIKVLYDYLKTEREGSAIIRHGN